MFHVQQQVPGGLIGLISALQALHKRFPSSMWFEPAPLLLRMVAQAVRVEDLQKDPSLVRRLMGQEVGVGVGVKSRL